MTPPEMRVIRFLPLSHQAVTNQSHAPPAFMDFGSWTDRRLDTLRIRRLVVGWIVGSISVVAGMSFIVLTSKGVAASEEEDDGPIEVQLAKEPEPEPPPPPPPPPEAAKAAAQTALGGADDDLRRKAPREGARQGPPDRAKRWRRSPKEAPAVVSAAPPPPPPPVVRERPTVKKPIRLTEDMPKPVQLVEEYAGVPAGREGGGHRRCRRRALRHRRRRLGARREGAQGTARAPRRVRRSRQDLALPTHHRRRHAGRRRPHGSFPVPHPLIRCLKRQEKAPHVVRSRSHLHHHVTALEGDLRGAAPDGGAQHRRDGRALDRLPALGQGIEALRSEARPRSSKSGASRRSSSSRTSTRARRSPGCLPRRSAATCAASRRPRAR